MMTSVVRAPAMLHVLTLFAFWCRVSLADRLAHEDVATVFKCDCAGPAPAQAFLQSNESESRLPCTILGADGSYITTQPSTVLGNGQFGEIVKAEGSGPSGEGTTPIHAAVKYFVGSSTESARGREFKILKIVTDYASLKKDDSLLAFEPHFGRTNLCCGEPCLITQYVEGKPLSCILQECGFNIKNHDMPTKDIPREYDKHFWQYIMLQILWAFSKSADARVFNPDQHLRNIMLKPRSNHIVFIDWGEAHTADDDDGQVGYLNERLFTAQDKPGTQPQFFTMLTKIMPHEIKKQYELLRIRLGSSASGGFKAGDVLYLEAFAPPRSSTGLELAAMDEDDEDDDEGVWPDPAQPGPFFKDAGQDTRDLLNHLARRHYLPRHPEDFPSLSEKYFGMKRLTSLRNATGMAEVMGSQSQTKEHVFNVNGPNAFPARGHAKRGRSLSEPRSRGKPAMT